ncbi:MAG: hypothetical protein FD175_389 [Beijerinckiaceae bacterium]|nr:MAG: hypothetical protein FD175_389 [Beijerinckiaceae bacterium]
MALVDLTDWLDLQTGDNSIWYIKRLSANDTLANGSNQAGPYVPKNLAFDVFPQIDTGNIKNPDVWFNLYIDSHADHKKARLVYYNNRRATGGGTRNECRITNLGGGASSLLDPESTGSIAVFVFRPEESGEIAVYVWVCGHTTEEDVVEERLGVAELLAQLTRERMLTTIIVLHDIPMAARLADRLALLRNGTLIALGDRADVLASTAMSEVFQVEFVTQRVAGDRVEIRNMQLLAKE